MFDRIKEILIEELGVDERAVIPSATLVDDLGINSLEFVNAVMVIEDEYEITTEQEKLETLKTVGDLVQYIESLVD